MNKFQTNPENIIGNICFVIAFALLLLHAAHGFHLTTLDMFGSVPAITWAVFSIAVRQFKN